MVEIFTWLKKHLKKKLVASDLYTDVDMIHIYIYTLFRDKSYHNSIANTKWGMKIYILNAK